MSVFKLVLYFLTIFMLGLFFVGGPDYYSPRSYKYFWNFGHIIFFAISSYLLLNQWKALKRKSYPVQILSIVTLAVVFGVLIEILQAKWVFLGRNAEYRDLLRNIIGALMGLFFLSSARLSMPRLGRIVAQCSLLICLVIEVVPLVAALIDEQRARQSFPELANFESRLEASRWSRGSADNSIALNGQYSLKVVLNTDKYSGLSMRYFPADWQGYQRLVFSIFNPEADMLAVTFRIHDKVHVAGGQSYSDRFNRRFQLQSGWNTLHVDLEKVRSAPENRSMDMKDISGFGFFATSLARPRIVYLDGVRLE